MAIGRITVKGRQKLCEAHAGQRILPTVVKMAFGNGGIDENGTVIEVTGEEVSLKSELLQKEIDSYSFPVGTTCRYSVKLNKEELANEQISEQGLFDSDGDLIAYKTFLPKGKDIDMEFVFEMDEVF